MQEVKITRTSRDCVWLDSEGLYLFHPKIDTATLFEDGDFYFLVSEYSGIYTVSVFNKTGYFDSSISIANRTLCNKTPLELVKYLNDKLCS